MHPKNIFALLLAICCASCQTYVSKNGAHHRQFFPARENTHHYAFDTSRFIKQQFSLAHYTNCTGYMQQKKIIEPVEGADLESFASTGQRYYVYFWNPVCPGTLADIHKLDSVSKTGVHVVIISLRKNYDAIDKILSKTDFCRAPYYTIENTKYSDRLLVRKIRIIREACSNCYEQYKDDLAVADYLLIENGTIRPVLYTEKNLLSQ